MPHWHQIFVIFMIYAILSRNFAEFRRRYPFLDVWLEMHALAFMELGEKYDVQHLKLLTEGEMLRQLDRKNMVEFFSIGSLFRANKILEAALKLTKANMAWLRSQVSLAQFNSLIRMWILGGSRCWLKIVIGENDSV